MLFLYKLINYYNLYNKLTIKIICDRIKEKWGVNMDENNVNQTVNESTVPEQPKLGWNWGAFMFNWTWGVGNRCYLPLLSLVPFVGFIWAFVCGACGNKWAWQNGYFKTPEEFNKTQSTWSRAGLIAFIICVALTVMYILLFALFIAIAVLSNGFHNL